MGSAPGQVGPAGRQRGLAGSLLGVLGAVLCAALLASGCDPIEPMPVGRVCDDVGYSIANRTLACTGDADLAVARHQRFEGRYRCLVASLDEPIDAYYACPVKLRTLPCSRAQEMGDDLDRWLAADPNCKLFLALADGSPLPEPTGAEGLEGAGGSSANQPGGAGGSP